MPRDSKSLGAYFTPEAVADALVRWAVQNPADLLLDPSSGDGRFIALHPNSVGVERDPANRTPWYTVPDVRRPEFVLTYMSGRSPALAANHSRCTCTNALLAVDL